MAPSRTGVARSLLLLVEFVLLVGPAFILPPAIISTITTTTTVRAGRFKRDSQGRTRKGGAQEKGKWKVKNPCGEAHAQDETDAPMTEVTDSDAHEAGAGVAAAGEDNQYETTADEGESSTIGTPLTAATLPPSHGASRDEQAALAAERLKRNGFRSRILGGGTPAFLQSRPLVDAGNCFLSTRPDLVQEHAQPEQGGQILAVGRGPLASFTDGMRSALPVNDVPPDEQNNHEGKGSLVFHVHVKIGLGGKRWTFEYPSTGSQRDFPTVDDLYNRIRTKGTSGIYRSRTVPAGDFSQERQDNDPSGRIIDDGSDTNTTLLLEETAADLELGAASSKLSFVYRHAKLVPNATYQLVRGAGPRVLRTSNAEGEAFFFQNGQYSWSRAVENLGQDTVDLQIRAVPFAPLMYKDQGRVHLYKGQGRLPFASFMYKESKGPLPPGAEKEVMVLARTTARSSSGQHVHGRENEGAETTTQEQHQVRGQREDPNPLVALGPGAAFRPPRPPNGKQSETESAAASLRPTKKYKVQVSPKRSDAFSIFPGQIDHSIEDFEVYLDVAKLLVDGNVEKISLHYLPAEDEVDEHRARSSTSSPVVEVPVPSAARRGIIPQKLETHQVRCCGVDSSWPFRATPSEWLRYLAHDMRVARDVLPPHPVYQYQQGLPRGFYIAPPVLRRLVDGIQRGWYAVPRGWPRVLQEGGGVAPALGPGAGAGGRPHVVPPRRMWLPLPPGHGGMEWGYLLRANARPPQEDPFPLMLLRAAPHQPGPPVPAAPPPAGAAGQVFVFVPFRGGEELPGAAAAGVFMRLQQVMNMIRLDQVQPDELGRPPRPPQEEAERGDDHAEAATLRRRNAELLAENRRLQQELEQRVYGPQQPPDSRAQRQQRLRQEAGPAAKGWHSQSFATLNGSRRDLRFPVSRPFVRVDIQRLRSPAPRWNEDGELVELPVKITHTLVAPVFSDPVANLGGADATRSTGMVPPGARAPPADAETEMVARNGYTSPKKHHDHTEQAVEPLTFSGLRSEIILKQEQKYIKVQEAGKTPLLIYVRSKAKATPGNGKAAPLQYYGAKAMARERAPAAEGLGQHDVVEDNPDVDAGAWWSVFPRHDEYNLDVDGLREGEDPGGVAHCAQAGNGLHVVLQYEKGMNYHDATSSTGVEHVARDVGQEKEREHPACGDETKTLKKVLLFKQPGAV